MLLFCLKVNIGLTSSPLQLVTITNENATFNCFPLTSIFDVVDIQWLVNGVLSDELELEATDVVTEFAIFRSTRIGTLTFISISPSLNETSLRCRARLRSGSLSVPSGNAILLLQGNVHMQLCALS